MMKLGPPGCSNSLISMLALLFLLQSTEELRETASGLYERRGVKDSVPLLQPPACAVLACLAAPALSLSLLSGRSGHEVLGGQVVVQHQRAGGEAAGGLGDGK